MFPRKKVSENEGVKIFYVDKFDPRMPHPRKLIFRNYHHLENHPIAAKLSPESILLQVARGCLILVKFSPPMYKIPTLLSHLSLGWGQMVVVVGGIDRKRGMDNFTVKSLLGEVPVMFVQTC